MSGRRVLLVLVVIVVFAAAAIAYAASRTSMINLETTSTLSSSAQSSVGTSSGSSSSSMEGVVSGYVIASPSQPTCSSGQNCDENMTGYELVFTAVCGSSSCQSQMAPLNPAGHYSILLAAGRYTVTGLSPNCPWTGCSAAFPQTVTAVGGMQVEFNVDIDTGIR